MNFALAVFAKRRVIWNGVGVLVALRGQIGFGSLRGSASCDSSLGHRMWTVMLGNFGLQRMKDSRGDWVAIPLVPRFSPIGNRPGPLRRAG